MNNFLYFLIENEKIFVYSLFKDQIDNLVFNENNFIEFDCDLENLQTDVLTKLKINNLDDFKLFYGIDKDLKLFERPFSRVFSAEKMLFPELKKLIESYKNKAKKEKIKKEGTTIKFEIRSNKLFIFENNEKIVLNQKDFFDVNEEIDDLEELLLNYYETANFNSFKIQYTIDKESKLIENYLKSVFGKNIEKIEFVVDFANLLKEFKKENSLIKKNWNVDFLKEFNFENGIKFLKNVDFKSNLNVFINTKE